jgi:[phosphatase 2A protein]-leucine-carboxy methyltransferase
MLLEVAVEVVVELLQEWPTQSHEPTKQYATPITMPLPLDSVYLLLLLPSTHRMPQIDHHKAVSLGYIDDPFAQCFTSGTPRKQPLINRGTYTRTMAIDSLLSQFMSATSSATNERQIISLGAGTDTRYFRLRARNAYPTLTYHEFDFPDIAAAKIRTINTSISRLLPPGTLKVNEEAYFCHALDLRNLASKAVTDFKGLRTDIPTLLISECCLCYLQDTIASQVIRWFISQMPASMVILYEPVGVDDAFGQRMVQNLEAQGIVMPTFQTYKTLEDQKARLAGLGFDEPRAENTETIWETWIPEEERERVSSCSLSFLSFFFFFPFLFSTTSLQLKDWIAISEFTYSHNLQRSIRILYLDHRLMQV